MRYIATNANFAIIANAMLIKIGLVINCILIRSVFRALTMSSHCRSPVQPLSSRFALSCHTHLLGSTQHVLTHIDTHLHLVASTMSIGTCLRRCPYPYAILAPCC